MQVEIIQRFEVGEMREGFECLEFSYLGIQSAMWREKEEFMDFAAKGEREVEKERKEVKCEI